MRPRSDHTAVARFDFDEMEQRIIRAAENLLHGDAYLLEHSVNERSITHQLAIHVKQQFPTWDVDCEYNRNHDLVKQLRLPIRCDLRADDLNATTVFPDVIVHRRGSDDNLVVIEVKKSTNHENDDWDLRKLSGFVEELGYRLGAFFRFRTGTADLRYEHRFIRHN
jgi:hypothetical protein